MKVEFQGLAVSFDDLPVGGFFMFELSRGGSFGVCVSIAGVKKAVIVFPKPGSPPERVTLQVGGLTNERFISFPNSELRPDLSSIAGGEAGSQGALTSVDGQYYMRAQEGAHYRNFNVQSGQAEDPKGTGDAFHFARWKIGSMVDQKFEVIFSFPSTSV